MYTLEDNTSAKQITNKCSSPFVCEDVVLEQPQSVISCGIAPTSMRFLSACFLMASYHESLLINMHMHMHT